MSVPNLLSDAPQNSIETLGASMRPVSGVAISKAAPAGARSRPLLLLERTMYRDGRTPFTSVFSIQVIGCLEEERLRHALARTQAKHPLLRSVVEGADAPRFVLEDRPAPIRLRIVERGGEDDWQTVAREEWVTPFAERHEPLVRVVWLRGGDVHELVLVGHHCLCDGHAGITLLRDILAAYDQPEQDIGSYESLGALEDLTPRALLDDRRFERRARSRAGILRLSLLLKWPFLTKRSRRPSPPITAEQIYFRRWNTGRETARALAERCRAEGVTVLAAVSVAFMQAFREIRGPRGLGRTSAMVNARRFLPLLPADGLFGLAPSAVLRSKGLPPPRRMSARDFWAHARVVKADLTRRVERIGGRMYETLAALERLHDRYAAIVAHFENAPSTPNLTFSNLGRLQVRQRYRDFTVEKIYSPLVMVSPTPANTVVISSFDGDMEFALISDEQSLPQAQALEIRHRAMEILLRACGRAAV
jgi:hypothetical protein